MSIFTFDFNLNDYYGNVFSPIRYFHTVNREDMAVQFMENIARFHMPVNDSMSCNVADCIYECIKHMSDIGPMGYSPARIKVNHFTEQLYRRYHKDELADDPILLQIDCDKGKRDYYAVRLDKSTRGRVQLIVMKV